MVRRAHHDPVFVRQLRVKRIVCGEGTVPHRRPKEVSFQAQQKFEYLYVKLVIEAAEFIFSPTSQRGCFIIEKNPAVFDYR